MTTRVRIGGSATRGTPILPPTFGSGSIPVSDLNPGENGQELETEGGVVQWVFGDDDMLIVANLAALSATDMTVRGDSETAYVQSLRSYFIYDQTSAITSDGITIVNATGGGRWLRQPIPSLSWAYQAAWFCNPTTGSDQNDGSTAPTAIQTLAELDRRLSNQILQQTTVVTLLGSYSAQYLKFHNLRINSNLANVGGIGPFRFVIVGDSSAWTTFYTSNVAGVTSYQAVTRVAAGVRYAITDTNLGVTDPATFVGRRIRLTSGANSGATAWVLKKLSATQFATGAFMAALNAPTAIIFPVTIVAPAAGDRYVIEDVVGLKGIEVVTGVTRADLRDGTATTVLASPNVAHVDVGQGSTTAAALADSNVVMGNLVFGVAESPRPTIYASRVASLNIAMGSGTIVGCLLACPASIQVNAAGLINITCFLAIGAAVGASVSATLLCANGQSCSTANDTTSQGVSIVAQPGKILSNSLLGLGVYDCVDAAVVVPVNSTFVNFVVLYGTNPSAPAGVRVQSGGTLRFSSPNKPVITGSTPGTNDIQLNEGAFQAAWTAMPVALPGIGRIVADNASDFGRIYRTGVAAAIGSTGIFGAIPDKGLYALEVYLAVTTAGNAGDTCTVTITWTDDAQAESVAVISVVSVAAKGQFQARRLIENNSASVNPAYSVSFPTKTGAPVITLRIVARLLQNATA